jgi:L-alanine-DL-glutamate epimerase-like enolase superfamily enzyme
MAAPMVTVVDAVEVEAYAVPTEQRESDGTLEWGQTELVVVRVRSGATAGLGWTYASRAGAELVHAVLRPALVGLSPLAIPAAWAAMSARLRNVGQTGLGSMALAAVDIALWDLKARLLGLALPDLFGAVRDAVELYGSGGFTSYDEAQLARQLAGWVEQGFRRVKMKVGRAPAADLRRVKRAREAIGPDAELFVDANGAYGRKQALRLAEAFAAEARVCWLEEPVSSEDLAGLRLLRDRAPAGMEIAAGEYGDRPDYFRRMLEAGAVDCLQADVTRCGGYTGFLRVAALAEAWHLPLSAHCAPQLHAPVACAVPGLRHVEYFHDHARIERMLFAGGLEPQEGRLRPDRSRPGHGLELKTAEAAAYRV